MSTSKGETAMGGSDGGHAWGSGLKSKVQSLCRTASKSQEECSTGTHIRGVRAREMAEHRDALGRFSGDTLAAMNALRRLAAPLVATPIFLYSQLLFAATADLRVVKTASSALVERGDSLQWTITVSNAGPDAADNVVLTDALPPQLTFNSIVAPASYSCTTPAPGTNGTVTCTRSGSMANGTSEVFTLNTTVAPTAAPGAFPNTAQVTSTTADPLPANNLSAGISAVVPPFPDVSITKSAGAGPFTAGNNVPFTITVSNAGPGSAHNVAVTDTIPAGSTLVSATPSQGTCTGSVCTLGTIASGGTATITLVVNAPSTPGTLVNSASVTLSETDPNLTNNTASAMVTTQAPGSPAPIPTLPPWMLLVLGFALAAIAARGGR